MKQEFDSMRHEFGDLRGRMDRLMVAMAQMRGDLFDFRGEFEVKLSKFSSDIHDRLNTFIPTVQAAQRDRKTASDQYMLHQDRIDDHERRLSQLEGRQEKP